MKSLPILLRRWWSLYHKQTPAERAIEPAIAALGVPYRFQHPTCGVFPDYVLLEQRLVIEVDDASHARASKRKADAERTAKLNAAGWTVVRCTNYEALSDPHGAVDAMMAAAGLTLRTRKATP